MNETLVLTESTYYILLLRSFFEGIPEALEEAADRTAFTEENELLNVVMTLKPKLRTPLYMYYYEEYSVKEIANRFNCGQSKIKMMLKRTREKLLTHLKKEGFYP